MESDVKILATGGYIEASLRWINGAFMRRARSGAGLIGRKKLGFHELANLGQEFKYATTVMLARESQLRKERETFNAIRQGRDRRHSSVKTDREFAIKVLGRMLRPAIAKSSRKTYRVFAALYEQAPYPALEGIQPIIDELSTPNS